MPKGILYVETRPSSPEEAEQYHQWYNETHLKEIVAIDGFVSARRFEPMGHDGAFVAIYEIEADDLDAVPARMTEAMRSGQTSKMVSVELDPPPTVRFYREIADYTG